MTEKQPSVFLCDIEGTVAPISLVSEQLFPYARKHLAQYLKENLTSLEVQNDLRLLAAENRAEQSPDCPTAMQLWGDGHAMADGSAPEGV